MTIPEPDDLIAHRGFVRSLALALVHDVNDAEDVTHDVMVAALDRPRPVRSLKAWLAGVTRNVVRMRFRAEGRRPHREIAAARPEAVPSAAEHVARLETLRSLVAAVESLVEPYRSTVLLRYFDGLKPAEIARRTLTPLTTVKSRLRRGLEMLRERLDARPGGRRNWSVLLLPLCRPHAPAATSVAAAGLAAIVPGAILLSTKTKFIAAAIVAVLVAGATLTVALRPFDGGAPALDGGGLLLDPEGDFDGVPLDDLVEFDFSAPPVRVEGGVAGADGRPLGGARITVHTQSETLTAETDENGAYSLDLPPTTPIPHLEAGRWDPGHRFTVEADGHAPAHVRVRAPPPWTRHSAPPVLLERAAGMLTVRVVGPDGNAVGDAAVYLDVPTRNHRHGRVRTIYRAPDGVFGPVPVPAGNVIVRARGPGLPEATVERFVPPGGPRDVEMVVRLPEPSFATGVVVDTKGRPVSGARVRYLTWGRGLYLPVDAGSTAEPFPPTFTTDAEGRFDVPVTRGGKCQVRVEKAGFVCPEERIDMLAETESRVVLHPAARLEGRFRLDGFGPLPAGLRVGAYPKDADRPIEINSGPDGRFDLAPVFPGPVVLWVGNGPFHLGTLEFDLAPGEVRMGLDILLEPDSVLWGTVRDAETGEPIEGVLVGADDGAYGSQGLFTDAEGRFEVPWNRPTRETWKRMIGFARVGYDYESIEIGPATATDLEVRLWRRDEPARLEPEAPLASAADSTVAILVTDRDGSALPNAWAEWGEKTPCLSAADEQGRILVSEDTDILTVGAPGRATRKVTLGDDPETVVALDPGGAARIRVVDRGGSPRPGVAVTLVDKRRSVSDAEGRVRFEGLSLGLGVLVRADEGVGPVSTVWAEAGGDEVLLVAPPPARVRVRFATKPPPLGGNDHVNCDVYSLDRIHAERGDYAGSWAPCDPAGDEYVVSCFAERFLLHFTYPGGPWRVFEIDLSRGGEAVVTYAFGPDEPAEIHVLDHEGSPVENATIALIAGRAWFAMTGRDGRARATHAVPIGNHQLVVETSDRAPQLFGPIDTTRPATLRLLRTGRVGGTISHGGERIADGKVRIHTHPGTAGEWAPVGEDGAFLLPHGVPEGPCRLEVRTPDAVPHFTEVSVTAGKTAEVTVHLP